MTKLATSLLVVLCSIIFNTCKNEDNNPAQSESQNIYGIYKLTLSYSNFPYEDQYQRIDFVSGSLTLNNNNSYVFSFKEAITHKNVTPVVTDTVDVGHGGSFSRNGNTLTFDPTIGAFGACGGTGILNYPNISISDCGHYYTKQ